MSVTDGGPTDSMSKEDTAMNIYRKIWEQHYGSIPKDENGRSYEIHHIDGNHSNNHIDNLKCVSIQEHYDIHYDQKDYGACYYIALSMKKTPKEISDIISKSNKKRIENGTLPLLNKELSKQWAKKRTEEGKNPFTGGKIQKESNKRRVKSGTHNFLINENHISLQKVTCPYCNIVTNKGNAKRWHFDNCKMKGE
mgnify:CR=1 FL=1